MPPVNLALNNTNTLRLNDIHVEFVNSDETLAKDLTDNAHVIFHIRPDASKCGCGEHSKHLRCPFARSRGNPKTLHESASLVTGGGSNLHADCGGPSPGAK